MQQTPFYPLNLFRFYNFQFGSSQQLKNEGLKAALSRPALDRGQVLAMAQQYLGAVADGTFLEKVGEEMSL